MQTRSHRAPRSLLAGLCAASILAPQAGAQNARVLENPAVQRGRELVSRNCSGCHNVALKGPSLNRAAPPFRDLGDRHTPETLRQSVGEAVADDHNGMPAIYLSGDDARAVEAFLTAFAHADKKTRQRLSVPSCLARAC